MLMKVSEKTRQINEQLENCYQLRELVKIMETSNLIDFDIIQENVGGQQYRCWYGLYQDNNKHAPAFHYQQIAGHFGCNEEDARRMFGPSSSATLHERARHLDAHIFLLENARR